MVEDIGNFLAKIRIQQNYSMRRLSRESGLSANCISLVERGKNSPSFDTINKILNSMGLQLELVVKPITKE